MDALSTNHTTFFGLPFEIRRLIYEHALCSDPEILACRCAAILKPTPFLGNCTEASDLRDYVLDMPYALMASKQMYFESLPVAVQRQQHTPSFVFGGTKCLTTFLKALPTQHSQQIRVVLRLTTRSSWSHRTSEPDCTLASFDSLVSGLGIGTGKSYTVSTKEVRVLPDEVGEGLELLQAELELSMIS